MNRNALVVCSHLPGEGHFRSERFDVAAYECRDDMDYWAALADFWQSDETLVNVEHDIEVTDNHIAALLGCPEPLCTWAYRCHWISTGIPAGVYAMGTGKRARGSAASPKYIRGGETHARWSAIGLVKISAEARVKPLRREKWNWLELAVHDAVKRPWHIHWPEVEHHHW